jgi:outer membrane protein assembly factor BamA
VGKSIINIFAVLNDSPQILEYFSSYKNKLSVRVLIGLIAVITASSCNPTKYISEGETLLERNYINVNTGEISKSELTRYVRQQPNKRIFGARFHLGLYNWSNLEKDNWFHTWLSNIGEEPVVYDPYSTGRSKDQIKSFLHSKGYFDSNVLETIETAKKRSKVYYDIEVKTPYVIDALQYDIEDENLLRLILFDSINCLIRTGKPYDVDVMIAETLRLEKFIRDQGFYGFSNEYISMEVDSTIGNRRVSITYKVANAKSPDRSSVQKTIPHSHYRLRKVFIQPEFSPGRALAEGAGYFNSLDTVLFNGYYFIAPPGKPLIRYNLLAQSLFINPGATFNLSNTERTQKRLNSLRSFRLVNINYTEPDSYSVGPDGDRYIDAVIQLTPFIQQSFTYELEGTNSAGNLGAAVNLLYQHKNLFHGAEQFNMKLKGAYESLNEEITGFRNAQELGAEANLQFPEFLLPFFKTENFIKKYDPKTYLKLAYNYQRIPVFTRTVANAAFGYNWNSGRSSTHLLFPFQLNLVKLPYIDPDFSLRIDSSFYLSSSYRDVLILGGSYTYTFNNQNILRKRDNTFLKLNFETAGNLLAAGSRITGATMTDSSYTFLGQQYAQFVRADIDFRYKRVLNDVSSVVYRAFVGLGIPFGNSRAMPFEKQYFGGGANGLRAWQVRSLGPGSFDNDIPAFINQTADMKIELNTEYRFKLFWILEGAVFVDAGNIWTIRDDPDRPGAVFKFNKFYDDLAIGTGLGMRFDLKFVLLRADMGVKLRDPAIQDYPKWIRLRRPYDLRDDFTFVVGIGYPF